MMKWFTKGTSTEVHTIGHQEVVSIQGRRRNDKYAGLHTIIKFLHYVVSFSPLQIKSFCRTWAPSSCGNLNVTEALRATRAREQRGRRQTSELFLFVEIQKWSFYSGGSSCFPYSSATWQASAGAVSHWAPSRPTLPQPPLSLPLCLPRHSLFLPLSFHHPPPSAGKCSRPAVETAWLRRRPSRFTGDKFVCVSWAATLGSRTLTRSCQREGKSRPSTSSALPPPPCPTVCVHGSFQQAQQGLYEETDPPWSQGFPLGPGSPSLVSPHNTSCMHSRGAKNTQSKLPQAHNGSPRQLPLSHGKIMDGGVWQRRRTTYENTILCTASALLDSFVCETLSEETPRLENWWCVMWKRSCSTNHVTVEKSEVSLNRGQKRLSQ